MGHSATANRRALIDQVRLCIDQTNAMTGLATDVREAHNTFATHTGADLRRLDSRGDAHMALIKALEAQADRERSRLTMTRAELAQVNIERNWFTDGLTFFQRLRWLLTGAWPKPGTYDEVTARATETLREADAAVATAEKTMVRAAAVPPPAFAAQSYGGMSAGMAPKPLP